MINMPALTRTLSAQQRATALALAEKWCGSELVGLRMTTFQTILKFETDKVGVISRRALWYNLEIVSSLFNQFGLATPRLPVLEHAVKHVFKNKSMDLSVAAMKCESWGMRRLYTYVRKRALDKRSHTARAAIPH